ncbi:MAG: hypothetical protein ACI4QM_01865, partial [Alphaproteobacteria bacterium]
MLKGIIFLISFCIGFGWQFAHRPVIHIYLDFATLPSLLQMIDFVQAPEKDQKVIIWRRFPQRYKYVDLDTLNAQQIPLPVSEVYNAEALSIIDRHIQHLYMNNPWADYVIHANLWWGRALTCILQHIPPERVKHLYLYEDGLSNVAFSRKTYTVRQSVKTAFADDLKLAIAGKADYHHNQMFSFHKLYPTTYYISFIDYMKT